MQRRSLVLATGIYPPDLGGPATYVAGLARALSRKGYEVQVLTYAKTNQHTTEDGYTVERIPTNGGPLFRWFRYAMALRRISSPTSCVIAFSSVSVGVPLLLARLSCRKILRLGGEFFWERATDWGSSLSLREWMHSSSFWHRCCRTVTSFLLRSFDAIVYSTQFQLDLHKEIFKFSLPTMVIGNVIPLGEPVVHRAHSPFRLLFLGRFVRFKNIHLLLQACQQLSNVTLTIVGDGPCSKELQVLVHDLGLASQIQFHTPVHGTEKLKLFSDHDLLVLPSSTELSPHTAIEARVTGLPVLLTEETGLQNVPGIVLRSLRTPGEIVRSVCGIQESYAELATQALYPIAQRTWDDVAHEWESVILQA